jgi:general secretion pathway protein M
MNAVAKSSTSSVAALKQSAATFWEERNQRERMMLIVAGVVVVIALFYLILIDPALSGRKNLEKSLPALRQQSAELQSMSKDAAALSAKAAAPVTKMSKDSLDAALAKNNLKAQNVLFTGDTARVQLTGVSFASIVDWLDDMQRTARISVVDATVNPQAQPDMVNANLTLQQQGGGQ